MANFNDSLATTLRWEGGYNDRPADKGGPTNFGISQAQYPNLDIRNLTKDEAAKIYYNDYWLKFRIAEIKNQDLANLVFDMVVNHGQAVKIIQQTLSTYGKPVKIDNVMGSETIGALNKVFPYTFIPKLVAARKRYYDYLIRLDPLQVENKNGWYNRANAFNITMPVKVSGVLIFMGILGYIFYKNSR